MAQGFAFGTGSALARQAVGAVFGGGSTPAPAAPQQPPTASTPAPYPPAASFSGPQGCELDQREFMACLQRNPSNASNCDQYFNALQACQSRM